MEGRLGWFSLSTLTLDHGRAFCHIQNTLDCLIIISQFGKEPCSAAGTLKTFRGHASLPKRRPDAELGSSLTQKLPKVRPPLLSSKTFARMPFLLLRDSHR
jgi:hypothetical protein